MTLKISEMISQRKDQAKDLSAGVSACIDEISAGYSAYLSSQQQEGEPAIDTRQHLELVRRSIDAERKGLELLDTKVVGKSQDTTKGSQDIDEVAGKMVAKLRYVRNACRAFGPEGMKRSATRAEFPRRPLRILERAELIQTSLRKPDLGLKPMIDVEGLDEEFGGVAPDPAKLADILEPEKTRLGDLLDGRYTNKREDLDFRSHRADGIKEFDRRMRGLVHIIRGTLVLAGRDDLVARFSTALRRFTRRPKLVDDDIQGQTTEVASFEPTPWGELTASSESIQD